jgi:hypothetical protein
MKIRPQFFCLIFFLCILGQAKAQLILDSVLIERSRLIYPLGITEKWESIFSMPLKDHVIIGISGLEQGAFTDERDWSRAETALRSTRAFESVGLFTDTTDSRYANIYLALRESAPAAPTLLLQNGGGNLMLGAGYSTATLNGMNWQLTAAGYYRSENQAGAEGVLETQWNDIAGSRAFVGAGLRSGRFITSLYGRIGLGFHPQGGLSGGMQVNKQHGYDFVYGGAQPSLYSFDSKSAQTWITLALARRDMLFVTLLAGMNNTNRPQIISQAFDNTGHILLGFSSLADRTDTVQKGREIYTGGWGSAVLGRFFPVNGRSNINGFYYIGGMASQSGLSIRKKLYLYGHIAAGTGLETGQPLYTAQEFTGLGHYMATENLIIAARLQQQTVWNWTPFRQLIADHDTGIRGLRANSRAGSNRIIGTIESRARIIEIPAGLMLGATAFADAGTVWAAGENLSKTQWSASLGAGLLLLSAGRDFRLDAPLLRLDFAWRPDEAKGYGLLLSTSYSFSLIGQHKFILPSYIGGMAETE